MLMRRINAKISVVLQHTLIALCDFVPHEVLNYNMLLHAATSPLAVLRPFVLRDSYGPGI
jgi:hypothetical protein